MLPLKYRFIAAHKDGSQYHQNPDDVSVLGRTTCFSDLDLDNITHFFLVDHELENVFAVNLLTGAFAANGVDFLMHDPRDFQNAKKEIVVPQFRLIYFRRVQQIMEQGVESDGEQWQFKGKPKPLGERTSYRMGWQCTVNGKNHQRIMELF
jgi:hypothetical protein